MSPYAIQAGKYVLTDRLAEGGFLVIENGRFGSWSTGSPP